MGIYLNPGNAGFETIRNSFYVDKSGLISYIKPALVIELKWNKTADSAIRQIKEQHYPQVLEGFSHDILLVGINYDPETRQHTCRIEKYQVP